MTFGNGASQTGQSLAANAVSGSFINARERRQGRLERDRGQALLPRLARPAKVAGKIVLCDRGVNARIDKSLEVKNTGGIGMVLINTSANSVNADLHFVPTVHVDHVAGRSRPTRTARARPRRSRGVVANNLPAPFIAAFSSRGPLLAGDGDILKPDISLPGPGRPRRRGASGHGRLFDMLSGTSMASPHVAGLGACSTQLHPTWSPAAIKSALMTTALTCSRRPTFDWGSGHVDASKAATRASSTTPGSPTGSRSCAARASSATSGGSTRAT